MIFKIIILDLQSDNTELIIKKLYQRGKTFWNAYLTNYYSQFENLSKVHITLLWYQAFGFTKVDLVTETFFCMRGNNRNVSTLFKVESEITLCYVHTVSLVSLFPDYPDSKSGWESFIDTYDVTFAFRLGNVYN